MSEGRGGAPSTPAGFEALVREHQSRVRWQLRRLTRGDVALADELAQEAFVQAWRHIGGFRAEARVSTWLHRIALNQYLAHARRVHLPLVLDGGGPDAPEPPAAPDASDHTVQRIDVERALAALPEPERLALIHCFQLDLSHAEAAEVLGWPLGTLKSHVARGKARLRERLAAWNPREGVRT